MFDEEQRLAARAVLAIMKPYPDSLQAAESAVARTANAFRAARAAGLKTLTEVKQAAKESKKDES